MLLHNGASDGNSTHNTAFKCFYTIFTSYTLNDIYRYFSNTLDVAQTRSMKRFYLDLLFQSLAFLRKLLMLLSFSHQHLQRCFYALCFLIFFTDSIHFLGSIDCRRFFHNLFFSSEVNRLPFLLPKFSLQIAVEEKSELTTSRFFFYLDKLPYDSTREDSKSSPKRNVSRPTVTLRLKKTWSYLENGAVDDAVISRTHTTSLTAGGWLRNDYVVWWSPSTLYVNASMQLLQLVMGFLLYSLSFSLYDDAVAVCRLFATQHYYHPILSGWIVWIRSSRTAAAVCCTIWV